MKRTESYLGISPFKIASVTIRAAITNEKGSFANTTLERRPTTKVRVGCFLGKGSKMGTPAPAKCSGYWTCAEIKRHWGYGPILIVAVIFVSLRMASKVVECIEQDSTYARAHRTL